MNLLKVISVFFLFFVAAGAKAQSNVDAAGRAVALLLSAAFDAKPVKGIPKDQIRGTCDFKGGYCAGAKVKLSDANNKMLQEQIISSKDGFVFSSLPEGHYSVNIQYPRYKVSSPDFEVTNGKTVTIKLSEKP